MRRQGASTEPQILIAEDGQIAANDLQRTLTGLGYVVSGTATDSDQAVELAGASRPDVVLMNVGLAGAMDGSAAANQIRERWRIPVVLLTASPSDERLGRTARPHRYLVKPFHARELNATIVSVLHEHRLASELFEEQSWLRSLLGSLRDGAIATDQDGRVHFLNPRAEALTGWAHSEAIGKHVDEVYSITTFGGDRVHSQRMREPAAPGGPLEKERFLLQRRDGSVIAVEEATAGFAQNASTGGTVILFLDVTQRLNNERQSGNEAQISDRGEMETARLANTPAELRALAAHLMTVHEEERSSVARELHDDLGQRIAALEFRLNRLLTKLADVSGDVREELRAATSQITGLASSVRNISRGLHSSVISDLGIVTALRSLVEQCRQHGEDVSIIARDIPEQLPLDLSVVLYRIVQEALRNVARHAAGARVVIGLISAGDELILSIDDSGPGFELTQARSSGGIGLVSMQERARLAGGSLVMRSRPGQGTSIQVRVPLGKG